MATVGEAVFPGTNVFPNTNVYPGQGNEPLYRCYLAFDDVSVASPTWTDASDKLRVFDTERGRGSELEQFDAGKATIDLNNRLRTFDPIINPLIRPMNRVWLYEEFSGEVHDVFKGYVERWKQVSVGTGTSDAIARLQAVDEFKVLALDRLPPTDPPLSSYQDIVMFDEPVAYWGLNNPSMELVESATLGPQLLAVTGNLGSVFPGAIVGENPGSSGYCACVMSGGDWLNSGDIASGDPGHTDQLSEYAIEFWIKVALGSSLPGAGVYIAYGPATNAAPTAWREWFFRSDSTGQLTFHGVPASGTLTGTNAVTIVPGVWHHIVGVVVSNTIKFYLDGVDVGGSNAFVTPSYIAGAVPGGENVALLGQTVAGVSYDEFAIYRHALTQARISAHWIAGSARGYPRQSCGVRVSAVLDTTSNRAPRRSDSTTGGSRTMQGSMMNNQPPLDLLTEAATSEAVDAALFVSASGEIMFLTSGHRSVSPWNTVQATFDDDGTDLPYLDLDEPDLSDSFIFNEWNATIDGGSVQTASDAASIFANFRRSKSLNLHLSTDAQALTVAQAMLAKYKDAFQRIPGIKPLMADPNVAEAVFRRELMDRIRVFRTPPGGGARYDQTLFIQNIKFHKEEGKVVECTLGVSPL